METQTPAAAPPKLRWFQYSLRSLMLFVVVCACLCSWFGVKLDQAKRHYRAECALRKAGATVQYYPPWMGGDSLLQTCISRILGKEYVAKVAAVRLRDLKVGDEMLPLIECLPEVQEIGLERTNVSDGSRPFPENWRCLILGNRLSRWHGC
jgi:hypothetical protein